VTCTVHSPLFTLTLLRSGDYTSGRAAPRTPFIHDTGWRWWICWGFQWVC